MNDSKMLVWPTNLMTSVVNVVLVGAGGNGSEVFDGLIKLHNALLCLGHEGGLKVTIIDPDLVSESNVIRQKFLPYEVGQSKAISLAHKANILFGTQWEALDELFPLSGGNGFGCKPDLIISCVDNYKARKSIYEYANRLSQQTLWMDLGNTNSSGQVVMGHIGGRGSQSKIRNVVDLFPEILTAKDKENKASCSSV